MVTKMSLKSRQELLASIQDKYKDGDWASKNKLLDGFIVATGYNRKHAIKLLNNVEVKSEILIPKKGKPRFYNDATIKVLEMLWHASSQICSKRIVPFLPELVQALERHGHLHIDDEIKAKVLSVSSATFDRLLKKEREKIGSGISTTKSGTLLKHQIKVRTFSDWNETEPGFFEADLVAHCGGSVTGTYLNSLVLTDIATTWTECIPLLKKSADDVIAGLETAISLLPYPILGFDVDNGSEFINHQVFDFCEKNSITFTRSRAYRKNDQAHVEAKNGSIVRRFIGYDRYEGMASWKIMLQLYASLRLYVNFFQPSLKLISKSREGSKTTKKYDDAKTPYQRILLSKDASTEVKKSLTEQYINLDPIKLKDEIDTLQKELWSLAWCGPIESVEEKSKNLAESNENVESKLYKKTRKPRKKMRDRDWKTRQDPFENVKEFIDFELRLCPTITAKSILEKLIEKSSEEFKMSQLRTLQRHVQKLREKDSERERGYQDLMINKKDMTTTLNLDSIIVE
jgi:hypothetical protein